MQFTIEETEKLQSELVGKLIFPNSNGYDEARTLWNGMFNKKPSLIIQCATAKDVILAVQFAKIRKVDLAIKGGGHNSAGTGSCDNGIQIDLSLMDKVEVNPGTKRVKVQGGCLLGKVDEETQKHGLAISSGIISHTGVGGLTLGGGYGWISRKFGMSIDNLVAVEIVTARGELVTANEYEHSELFWAVRGGGGNFGVVTMFEFQAAEIGTEVYSGPIVKQFEDLSSYLKFHREYVRTLPDEMTVWLVVRYAPPLPFIPEEYHGKLVILVPFVWIGEPEEGEKLMQPIRDFGKTLGDGSAMHPWTAWQSAFDGLVSHGARNYWKSHQLTDLTDGCIEVLEEFALTMPSEECEIFIPHLEGVSSRLASDATAFPHRYTPFLLNIHTRWQNESQDKECIQWARDFHTATNPFGRGVYVNFMSDLGEDRVREAYSPENWEKLAHLKYIWDKDNLFHINFNIKPEKLVVH